MGCVVGLDTYHRRGRRASCFACGPSWSLCGRRCGTGHGALILVRRRCVGMGWVGWLGMGWVGWNALRPCAGEGGGREGSLGGCRVGWG